MKKPDVFKAHPKLEKYFKTSDGTKFFQEHDAITHGKSLKDKTVEPVKRPAEVEADEPVKKPGTKKPEKDSTPGELTPMQKAKLRIEAIEKMETVAEVEKALEEETAKSVKAAGQERIEAIEASNEAIANKVKE